MTRHPKEIGAAVPSDYYITVPIKVRVNDLSRINEAANSEIAALRKKYPDDPTLVQFAIPSPLAGLNWFLSVSRLQYMYGGIEMIMEVSDIVSASRFSAEKTGNHLHDWWIDDAPEYVSEQAPSESQS